MQKQKKIPKRVFFKGLFISAVFLLSFVAIMSTMQPVQPVLAKGEGKEVLNMRFESLLDNKFKDLSEYGNDGTNKNALAGVSGAPNVGTQNKAVYFAYYPYQGEGGAAPDWIELGTDTSLKLDTSDFTIAFWLKFAGYNNGQTHACVFASKGKYNGADDYDLVAVWIVKSGSYNKVKLGFYGLYMWFFCVYTERIAYLTTIYPLRLGHT